MKILNLEVKNIRGIRNLQISPNGESLVVFGQNGTGKSAVVDAIDFLLTGNIARLAGRGCGNLCISEHGCHVDCRDDLKNTVVKAKIKIKDKEIDLERSIKNPSNLKVSPKSEKDLVLERLETAKLGQHLLSRREILKYITEEAGARAKEIQSLLNLSNIENLRSLLVTIKNTFESQLKNSNSNLNIAQSDICKILSLEGFSGDLVLAEINKLRDVLGGKKNSEIDSTSFKKDIVSYLFGARGDTLTIDQIKNTIKELRKLIQGEIPTSVGDDVVELKSKTVVCGYKEKLVNLLEAIKKEKKLKDYALYKQLYKFGIDLAGNSNICPLCNREWEGEDFKKYLENKSNENESVSEKESQISKLATGIKNHVDLIKTNINELKKVYKKFELKDFDDEKLNIYQEICTAWSNAMLCPLSSYDTEQWPMKEINEIFEVSYTMHLLKTLDDILLGIGQEYSKQQAAWDSLTKMEDAWDRYIRAACFQRDSKLYKEISSKLLDYFQESRDFILDDIYNKIESNFNDYYKTIHLEDEHQFSSNIEHKDSQLIVEVDFYGRGMFPPHALHSEGHQDSMGLCLFFALNKYLSSDIIDVIVLDDVVMSIDRNHRRAICTLFKRFFSEKQLIITTHETAWAKQLKTEGIVKNQNMFHFVNWNIDTGPTLEMEKDLWEKINCDLEKNDVPAAAHKLRRNAESFFENMCDLLEAQIVYRGNLRWDLGDYGDSTISVYKKLLSRAINNAKKNKDDLKLKELEELNEKSKEIISKTYIERWGINDSVHYSKWNELSANDFKPVVTVFRDLFNLFMCSYCGSSISLTKSVGEEERSFVSCKCGKVFWDVK